MKNYFTTTVGQEIPKARLQNSIESAHNGGPVLLPLLKGEKGLGKSHLMKGYRQGLEDAGFDCLMFKSPEEFRNAGENFDKLRTVILESKKWAIFIDEAHNFKNRATVRMDQIYNFILKATEKQNGEPVRFDSDNQVVVDRSRNVFCLATNFPKVLDKSDAFQSRLDQIDLARYTQPQLVEILKVMLSEHGFIANEKTLAMIANCGRGSARPMERIVDQLRVQLAAAGKNTINRDDVILSLQLAQFYPQGLSTHEIMILNRCMNPTRDNVLLASLPNIENSAFKESKGFLLERRLVTVDSKGLSTTDHGRVYLKETAALKFTLPA